MRGNNVRWTDGIVPYEFIPGFGKFAYQNFQDSLRN